MMETLASDGILTQNCRFDLFFGASSGEQKSKTINMFT